MFIRPRALAFPCRLDQAARQGDHRDRALWGARARGKRGGRPAKFKPKDIRIVKQIMKDKTVTASDIAKRFGVSRATIQRGLRRDREDIEAKELDKLLKAQKRAAKVGT